jgi:hypothetical protein
LAAISLAHIPSVNPIALPKLGYKYYAIYTAWIGFEFVWLYFTIIETKGPNGPLPLEEISALFDGEDVRREIAQNKLEAATRRADADMSEKKVSAEHLEDVHPTL